jgi:hypothetical protein
MQSPIPYEETRDRNDVTVGEAAMISDAPRQAALIVTGHLDLIFPVEGYIFDRSHGAQRSI